MEYLIPASLLAMAEGGHDAAGDDGVTMSAGDLYTELAELRDELRDALTRAARAEGELAATAALAAELRSRAERAETGLAEARKPALVRLIEALRRRT